MGRGGFKVDQKSVKERSRIYNLPQTLVPPAAVTYLVVAELLPRPLLFQPEGDDSTDSQGLWLFVHF